MVDPNPLQRTSFWFDSGVHTTCASIGLLIMRLSAAGMLLVAHGWPKMINFSSMAETFPDPIGMGSGLSLILAISAEVVAATLVVLGLLTRWASVPIAILLLVAAFAVHGGDPWKAKEFALIYALPFVLLIFTGAGRFSLDNVLARRGMEAGMPGLDAVAKPVR